MKARTVQGQATCPVCGKSVGLYTTDDITVRLKVHNPVRAGSDPAFWTQPGGILAKPQVCKGSRLEFITPE